jgi:FKBP-type peptidyl-prolyl cis-trans isomerase
MKRAVVLLILIGLTCLIPACSGENDDVKLDTTEKKFSYVMGYEAVGVINNLEAVTIDKEAFIKGIRDAFGNELPLLSQQEGLDVKALVFEKERTIRNQQIMQDTEKYLAEQKAFLAHNKTLDGITTTPSGLQYKVLAKGDGPLPLPDDSVRIHSRARLIDGTLVKSLSTSGTSVIIPVKGDLPFWEKALTLMPAGSRYRFFVPSDLAYGEIGNFIDGGQVGPNQLIIIDIELLEVKK